ncbi:MAG TPA: xanthine dehydrogenase molybdopterin binding subunit, partial [Kineobactrum sp.]
MRKLPTAAPVASGLQGDPVGQSALQDSAWRHVSGKAVYVDDMPDYPNQLHVATGHSSHAHARITRLNLDRVRSAPGVVDVITLDDILGNPDVAPVYDGDLLLAGSTVVHVGQTLF